MDSAPLTPDTISALSKLLQSGGSAAMLVVVWVAMQVKDSVRRYIDSTVTTHQTLIEQNRQILEELKKERP